MAANSLRTVTPARRGGKRGGLAGTVVSRNGVIGGLDTVTALEYVSTLLDSRWRVARNPRRLKLER